MRASSNNHYQKNLPFTDIQIHSNKYSEDETGYDSLSKHERMQSLAALSSSSSSCDQIINLVKNLPSPTDISTAYDTSDLHPSVAERVAQFSKRAQLEHVQPLRKLNRTRIQPIPDSTSDSAESFALSNHVVVVSSIDLPPFGGKLDYIHDDRFDSTTTVDRIKNDVIAIELTQEKSNFLKRFGEFIRSLPANILAVVFISLIGGLLVSAILIIVIY